VCRIKPRILDCRRCYSFIKQGFQELGRKGCGVNFETASVEDNKAEQYLTFNQSFMKTFASFAFAGMLALLSISANAAVWRVNNNPVVNANFNSITSALSSSSVAINDTVYVEGSAQNYGPLTVNKNVVLIGAGYFLTDNDSTQAFDQSSVVTSMSIAAAGARIFGFQINGSVTFSANDIVFERNRVNQTGSSATAINISSSRNNLTIRNNWIQRPITSSCCNAGWAIDVSTGSTNVYIIGNIIKAGTKANSSSWEPSQAGAIRMASNATAVLTNNVILGHMTLFNAIFNNNIQLNGTYSPTNMIQVAHNLGQSTQFGTSNGNLSNVNMATVFTYGPGGEDVDNHYQLLAGSPALGAGVSGVDAGAFGGDFPYYLSGIPAIPAVFEATIPTIVTTASGLNINTKIKAHD
jgi:hypothetical protein